MAPHVFVDETKTRGYLLAAIEVPASRLPVARRVVSDLIMPRQRRIHFKSESEPRRNKIADAIIDLGVNGMIYDAGRYADQRRGRRACLERLVQDLAELGAERLVLERDDSAVKADREILYARCRDAGISAALQYDHLRAHEDCLLSLPDAVAWCWARGGMWRGKIQKIVGEVREV